MWRLIWAQLSRRPGRTAALLAGVAVATASFSVLTGASQTGRLQVRGEVERHFRTSYDILVRPRGSRTAEERRHELVRPGALSGIAGGITAKQWRTVLHQPGVAVAAPVAIVGYALPQVLLPLDLTSELRNRRSALLRIDVSRSTDRGLTRRRDQPLFAYVTRRNLLPEPPNVGPDVVQAPRVMTKGGAIRPICNDGYSDQAPQGPFDPVARAGLRGNVDCASTVSGLWGAGFAPFRRGRVGAVVLTSLPFVIAAIDPVQEAKLTGLPRALTSGRALRATDRPSDTFVPRVPVLAANRPFADESTAVTARRLPTSALRRFESARSVRATEAALRVAAGPVVRRSAFDSGRIHSRLLATLKGRDGTAITVYWAVTPTSYEQQDDGSLQPRVVTNGSNAWQSPADNGYVAAPLSADDLQFRRLLPRVGAVSAQLGAVFPALHAVGEFDPNRLIGGRSDVDAALSTSLSRGLRPADPRSRRLLHDRALLPNGNIAGYQTQAPLLLTNLTSLPAFAGANFTPNQGAAPISAIRVRVAGAVGIDQASRERVRQTAESIAKATELDVDLTVGASAQRRVIDLPAGRHGRPALRLTENWVRKGVAIAILSAVDRKSVALFFLVLAVCILFVANATTAAVSARRIQLAVLASVGWSPRALFLNVFGEVALVGLIAGALGGLISAAAAPVLGVSVSVTRALLALPAAVLLCVAAALLPARRAAKAHPAEALRPDVRLEAAASSPSGISGLAFVNVRRSPARTLTAAAAMAFGVASLTILLAITLGFRGAVVGSVLGNAVAVNVRAVDYVATVIMVALSAAGVADVVYLNIRDRAAELAVLRATGWSERHISRLIVTEAALTGAAGAALGGALGMAGAVVLTGSLNGDVALAAVIAGCGGLLVATASGLIPDRLAGRRIVAAELTEE